MGKNWKKCLELFRDLNQSKNRFWRKLSTNWAKLVQISFSTVSVLARPNLSHLGPIWTNLDVKFIIHGVYTQGGGGALMAGRIKFSIDAWRIKGFMDNGCLMTSVLTSWWYGDIVKMKAAVYKWWLMGSWQYDKIRGYFGGLFRNVHTYVKYDNTSQYVC